MSAYVCCEASIKLEEVRICRQHLKRPVEGVRNAGERRWVDRGFPTGADFDQIVVEALKSANN